MNKIGIFGHDIALVLRLGVSLFFSVSGYDMTFEGGGEVNQRAWCGATALLCIS